MKKAKATATLANARFEKSRNQGEEMGNKYLEAPEEHGKGVGRGGALRGTMYVFRNLLHVERPGA